MRLSYNLKRRRDCDQMRLSYNLKRRRDCDQMRLSYNLKRRRCRFIECLPIVAHVKLWFLKAWPQ
jgi:hypothetical protein